MAGKRTKAKAARTREVQQPAPVDLLHNVSFASKAAYAHAEKLGMTWRDFALSLITPSGSGGYTKADVTKVHAEVESAAP
jgi:hypothetical protein